MRFENVGNSNKAWSEFASRPVRTVLSCFVVVVLMLTACSSGDEDEGDGDGGGTGGGDSEITIAYALPYSTVDGSFAFAATTGQVQRNVMEPLVDRDGADPSKLVPTLATSWERIDDRTVEFELREGVEFHDGSPFNAEAAEFAINRLYDEELAFGIRQTMGPQITAEAVSEYVLDVRTADPDPILEYRLTAAVIQSKQQFDEGGQEAWDSLSVGTGPYIMESWDRGREFVLVRNEDWWGGADTLDISRATWVERPDDESRLAAVESGEVQLGDRLPVEACIQALGEYCLNAPGSAISFLRPDQMSSEVLGDPRIREAIALAIDKETISEQLYSGAALSPTLITESMTGYNDSLQPYPYDPERAVSLVEEAAADGVPTDEPILVIADQTRLRKIENLVDVLRDQLSVLPLDISFEIQESTQFLDQFLGQPKSGRDLMTLHEHSNQSFDASVTMGSYGTCSGFNSTFCDPEIDELNEHASTLAGDERDAAYAEVLGKMHEEFAWIPLFVTQLRHGVVPELTWEPRTDAFYYLKEMQLTD